MRTSRNPLASIPIALALVLGVSMPSAGGPPPLNTSTIPSMIALVGTDALGAPDPAGNCQVVVRDLANNPVAGVSVVVDFSGTNDFGLCPSQPAGETLDAAGRTVTAVTDAHGVAPFVILGSASPGPPDPARERVSIFADGVLVGTVPVAAYDLDGTGGVRGSDLAIWTADFVSGSNAPRSDYDGSGAVGGGDLSRWATVFVRASSSFSCSAGIPASSR